MTTLFKFEVVATENRKTFLLTLQLPCWAVSVCNKTTTWRSSTRVYVQKFHSSLTQTYDFHTLTMQAAETSAYNEAHNDEHP